MKSKTTAGVLALLLGGLGLHKFYLNKPVQGLLYIIFCWTLIPGIFAFFEALAYFFTNENDWNLKYNPEIAVPKGIVPTEETKALAKEIAKEMVKDMKEEDKK